MRNLAITTIWDSHISRQWRSSGKLWAASLLRHQWEGQVRMDRNFMQPLFPVTRADLNESEFAPAIGRAKTKQVDWKALSRERQLDVADTVSAEEMFDWILFADADCVALRNLDHLFVGDGDLLVSLAHGQPDPGFVAVRGPRLQDFVRELRSTGGLTKSGLNSVIRSCGWRVREFERGEVLRPDDLNVSLADLANAAVIHFSGMKPEDKHRLAFAFHMMAVYHDRDGLFFDMIEA